MTSQPLFADFQQSEEAFAACALHWDQAFSAVAASHGQNGEWVPHYFDEETVEPLPPGPWEPLSERIMFQRYSPQLRRMLQIYQFPPDSEQPDLITHVVKSVPFGPPGLPPVIVLMIWLSLTDRTLEIVRSCMAALMEPTHTESSLRETLRPLAIDRKKG